MMYVPPYVYTCTMSKHSDQILHSLELRGGGCGCLCCVVLDACILYKRYTSRLGKEGERDVSD